MTTFSQRMGLKPMQKALQKPEELDEDLRNGLWNVITIFVWNQWEPIREFHSRKQTSEAIEQLVQDIWVKLFKSAFDRVPRIAGGQTSARAELRSLVMSHDWHEVYDLIDFLVRMYSPPRLRGPLSDAFNMVLARESAGLRFVDQVLVPITNPVEISSIETAIETSSKSVQAHMQAAMAMLSDRSNPDYRNSIKESISAVEAAVQSVAGKPGGGFNDCIKAIKQCKPLHSAFEGALVKLYGYTSDAAGIRHAMTDDESFTPARADAQFMLVSCSAFINYLWTIAAERGIKIGSKS